MKYLLRSPLSRVGLVILLLVILVAIFAPVLAPHDPLQVDLPNRLKPPSREHLLGTDEMGRDILSRIIYGARISLSISVRVIIVTFPFGALVGAIAGFYGGWLDETLMRLTDVFLSIPGLILALAISASLGPSLNNAMIALAIIWWPWYARVTRAVVLQVREMEYVEAARAEGLPSLAILFKHVLPNSLAPAMVNASLDLGFVILNAAGLSFVGLGAQPPTPEWGAMLSTAREFLRDAWWATTFPGLAILVTVLAFNLLGDGFRDMMDPKMRR
ncbi:MAG TPA: nickel transporter permease [Bacillota bacterium]